MTATGEPLALPAPRGLTSAALTEYQDALERVCERRSSAGDGPTVAPDGTDPAARAALMVLADLISQGWRIEKLVGADVWVQPPTEVSDQTGEKARIRDQELTRRDVQLAQNSVIRFVQRMEEPKEFKGSFRSVTNLMRDGEELAGLLSEARSNNAVDPESLRDIIDPYLEIAETNRRCVHTGLKLTDVWRYFRHTWSSVYQSTPGRSMLILVRDAAAPCHPVIGIAALSSPIMQISVRDRYIGWQPEEFLDQLQTRPYTTVIAWVRARLEQLRESLYVDDLIADGLYWPNQWHHPDDEVIRRLVSESKAARNDHGAYGRTIIGTLGRAAEPDWIKQAETDLFRSKRCLQLANLLRTRRALARLLAPGVSQEDYEKVISTPPGRRAIVDILRRTKAEAVGTEIADLSVCGSVPPYNPILGGKLVSMLAVGPEAVRAYGDRYSHKPSQIASAMAGRAIHRQSQLVFIGTTSLYGAQSSQYNRIRIPANTLGLGSQDIDFRRLGTSRSYGTAHLSSECVEALAHLVASRHNGRRVNSIFGEGVSPRLRKVRGGLDELGWPSDSLLRHRRRRAVYGVELASNTLDYLLGFASNPAYKFDKAVEGTGAITNWWFERWLANRIQSDSILEDVARHHTRRPLEHGAAVQIERPTLTLELFE